METFGRSDNLIYQITARTHTLIVVAHEIKSQIQKYSYIIIKFRFMKTKTKQLRNRTIDRINKLPTDKLENVDHFIDRIEKINNKEEILSYAGSWKDIDDDLFKEFTTDLHQKRNAERKRIL